MREPAINTKNIILEDVDSSMINKIGYDESHNILKIVFKNNSSYIYTGVEPFHYKNMMTNAKSIGRYFNDNIKNYAEKYACFRTEEFETENSSEEIEQATHEEIDNIINNL